MHHPKIFLVCVASALSAVASSNVSTWNVVWVGGQSNSVGTNSQRDGYPTWPSTPRIQMFCGKKYRCSYGDFAPAKVPVFGEANVGFSQTFANLLLPTLPEDEGVVIVNTGVGGTGFSSGYWTVPNGTLTQESLGAMKDLASAIPAKLGGDFKLKVMLWHQGEEDAGDNKQGYNATYCTYLERDLGKLVGFFRQNFPGASEGTPFIDGGLLPYWVGKVGNATSGVMRAIYALNTSRVCTATADSGIFSQFLPNGEPNGEPRDRSGVTHDVIHFNATQQVLMGYQYWSAYHTALTLTKVVPSAETRACGNLTLPAAVEIDQCVS